PLQPSGRLTRARESSPTASFLSMLSLLGCKSPDVPGSELRRNGRPLICRASALVGGLLLSEVALQLRRGPLDLLQGRENDLGNFGVFPELESSLNHSLRPLPDVVLILLCQLFTGFVGDFQLLCSAADASEFLFEGLQFGLGLLGGVL